MIQSIYTGITGMKAFQDALSVTSNNIANSQTTAHKSQKAMFEDLFYRTKSGSSATADYAGTNPMSIGNGVSLKTVANDFTQGTVAITGVKTDVALEGDGFFVLGTNQGDNLEFTRNGAFKLSEDQYLVTSGGQYVLGWDRDPVTGLVDTSKNPKPLYVPLEAAIQGTKTNNASFSGNIDFDMEVGESTRLQFPVYDSIGKKISVEVEFVKTGAGEFEYVIIPNESFRKSENVDSVYFNVKNSYSDLLKGEYSIDVVNSGTPGKVLVSVTDGEGNVLVDEQEIDNANQTVQLISTSGANAGNELMTIGFKQLAAGTTSTAKINVGEIGTAKFGVFGDLESIVTKGNAATPTSNEPVLDFISASSELPVDVKLDFSKITSYATDTSLVVNHVDGNEASSVTDYSITDGGVIQVMTNTGATIEVGKISIATFANNDGLVRNGSGNFKESNTSGFARITESGIGNAGVIKATSLENSNVDLTSEFVDLMVYQRAFQASSKIITVSDEVASGVINIIK